MRRFITYLLCTLTIVTNCICVSKNSINADSFTIRFEKTEMDLNQGDQMQLAIISPNGEISPTDLEWSSSKRTTVEVNDTGYIITHNCGTAIITARYKNDSSISATCTIRVHNYFYKGIVFSDDYKSAYGIYNDWFDDSTITVDAVVTNEGTDATCTREGHYFYVATISADISPDGHEHFDIESGTIAAYGHSLVQHNRIEPTCITDGNISYWECTRCNKVFSDSLGNTEIKSNSIILPSLGHSVSTQPSIIDYVDADCVSFGGYDEVYYCTRCNTEMYRNHIVIQPYGHYWTSLQITDYPTCTEPGEENVICNYCGITETVVMDPLGHNYGQWVYNGEEFKTHTRICNNDSSHFETELCNFSITDTDGYTMTYTCSICGGKYVEKLENPSVTVSGKIRIAGSNRFETSKTIATTFRRNYGRSSVANVVLANGDNFADALAGTYLAIVKDAPIIITRKGLESDINEYIKSIIRTGGTIYVLGGTSAIPNSCLSGLNGYNVKRLGGANRYETNILILQEVGVESEVILVATGKTYADSLSASSTGLPIVLVKDSLDSSQKAFLSKNKGKRIYILGGISAVNNTIQNQLGEYGTVSCIAGNNRFETSVKIANKFYKDPNAVVLAYSHDFPDGLCGGPLAYQIDAPLLLTKPGSESSARSYITSKGINDGYILGGTQKLTDTCVNIAFGISNGGSGGGSGGGSTVYSYVGNLNSHIFHKTNCPTVKNMKEVNKIGFSTREEAILANYTPCKVCNP